MKNIMVTSGLRYGKSSGMQLLKIWKEETGHIDVFTPVTFYFCGCHKQCR